MSEQIYKQLTRAQMLALLEWNLPEDCVSDDMLRVAVSNRLALKRLSPDDIQKVAA
jgi:hypothetical protein